MASQSVVVNRLTQRNCIRSLSLVSSNDPGVTSLELHYWCRGAFRVPTDPSALPLCDIVRLLPLWAPPGGPLRVKVPFGRWGQSVRELLSYWPVRLLCQSVSGMRDFGIGDCGSAHGRWGGQEVGWLVRVGKVIQRGMVD